MLKPLDLLRVLSGLIALAAVGCAGSAPPPAAGDLTAAGQHAASTEIAAPEEAADDPAAPLRNTLRWKTSSEVENYGFEVFRATSEDGPWTLLTENPIPGAGTSDEPRVYVYYDETISPGQDYYYHVESLSFAGVREKFTPVIHAPAKHLSPAAP